MNAAAAAAAPVATSAAEVDAGLAAVTVIIPALNEELGVVDVLARLPAVGAVIVVDNGSTDQTAQHARAAGAVVVAEPRRGYGSACLAGIAEIGRRVAEGGAAPAAVVFVDADGSDDAAALPRLVEPILRGERDLVIGSRMLGQREPGAMPPQAVFGNRLATALMRLFWGAPYTDLGPFRAIRYASLAGLGMTDRDYGWTIEMQLKAWRAGLRVAEQPTPYRRRIGVSKISGTVRGSVAAGVKILFCIARHGLVGR